MAGLAIELGLVVSPGLNGAFGVRRKCAATCALELFRFGLALWKKLTYKGQHNDARDNSSNDDFR